MTDDFIIQRLVGFYHWIVKGRHAVLLLFSLDMLESKIAEIYSVGRADFQTLQCLVQETPKEILIPLESIIELPISLA